MVAKGSTYVKKASLRPCMDLCGEMVFTGARKRCPECKKKLNNRLSKAYYARHPEKHRAAAIAARKKARTELLNAYGDMCACCGESEVAFLTLEHKNRDGKAHRMMLSGVNTRSDAVYRDLKNRGYPTDGYELLCFNCNHASWKLGTCPHRINRMAA